MRDSGQAVVFVAPQFVGYDAHAAGPPELSQAVVGVPTVFVHTIPQTFSVAEEDRYIIYVHSLYIPVSDHRTYEGHHPLLSMYMCATAIAS